MVSSCFYDSVIDGAMFCDIFVNLVVVLIWYCVGLASFFVATAVWGGEFL